MPAAHLDRRRLVRRHNPVLHEAGPTSALTVGNGDAALTVDVTGLQTLPAIHELRPDPRRVPPGGLEGLPAQRARAFDPADFQIPLRTQTSWGWYSSRPVRGFRFEEAVTCHRSERGMVPYADRMGLQRAGDPIPPALEAGAWFHFNPRRTHLGRLALVHADRPDATVDASLIQDVRTELDLWTGTIHARFAIDGRTVAVTTVADPENATFATRVDSEILADGWAIGWLFDPQPDDLAPFELPLRSGTTWERGTAGAWRGRRALEDADYEVLVTSDGQLSPAQDGIHATTRGGSLEVVVTLGAEGAADDGRRRSFDEVWMRADRWWGDYWQRGAAISFEGSTDPRAAELERRVVLSQYLTVVNGAGSAPPSETGLTYNTWSGKFHLEMHWWHGAHFPLWGRGDLLERSMAWYRSALPAAESTARAQGYRGARWPKQTDLTARESPSNIGVFLVWQQPHPIYLLELLHAEGRDRRFLEENLDLVEATAEFMADFAVETDFGVELKAPLIPAQESYQPDVAATSNPTFELAYWAWGLRTANAWRTRLGLAPREDWAHLADAVRPPERLEDGTYAAVATPPYLIRQDHPSMLMALGWLPETALIDRDTMRSTLDAVWGSWDLQTTWGWDYPVMAMTATALGDVGRALGALLLDSPKNVFLPNGHNPQIPGFLSLYLPANGGLLAAIAHLVGALDDGAATPVGWEIAAEGFPTGPAAMRRAPDSARSASPTRLPHEPSPLEPNPSTKVRTTS